ncbi:MAG: DUF1003 domain-containing protein [Ktedonobacteraceae bacterium]
MEDKQKNIMELTDIVDQDIETIVAMRMKAERKVSRHQRAIEKATNSLGRPLTLYIIALAIIIWIITSTLHSSLGLPAFDEPPFPWLQGIVSLSALVMTVFVLTTQSRQGKLTEQRRHLDLQITLLTERKASKIIELIEDLRRDIPSVKNHYDPEAQAMREPVDPHTALSALNQTLKEAAKEFELEIE